MTDLRKAAELALEALEDVFNLEKKDVGAINALRQALAQPKREWEELDVNDVMGLIAEHITDPSPELMDELYGLIAGADMLLQEKNT